MSETSGDVYPATQVTFTHDDRSHTVTFPAGTLARSAAPEHDCDYPVDLDPDGPWEWVCDDCGRVFELHVRA